MLRSPLALALALAVFGCVPTPVGAIRERVGGAVRQRSFASPTAYEAYLRAETAAARGDAGEALRQLDLAAMADPADGYVSARRVELLLASGALEDARAAATALTADRPELSAGWLALAAVCDREGNASGALDAARHALALDPDDPDVRAAVVGVAGGDPAAVAAARAAAPTAGVGDRAVAARALALDPAGMFRRSAAARRRERAVEHAERGEWALVDAALSPVVALDARRVVDRVRVVEARALDGRPRDAAALVAGLRGEGVRVAERARLWLLSGHADRAAEEAAAALAATPDDPLARNVLGHARLRRGDVIGAVDAWRGLARDAPAGPLVTLRRDLLSGAFEASGAVPGEPLAAPGVPWAIARIALATELSMGGWSPLADALLASAIGSLTTPTARGARDRLRVARAQSLAATGAVSEARAALSAVETPWGLHRRGALAAFSEPPAEVFADLRARSGDAHEDGLADAWVVLVCRVRRPGCDAAEESAALDRATRSAPVAPATLRARAIRSNDRREAGALARRAASADPLSPWSAALAQALDGASAR